MLARFIRAQLKFATLGLVAYTSFLLLAGFPNALAVGAIAGVLEFIPFVGPLISFILIVGIAILTGFPHWLLIVVFLALWRGIQDYIMAPYLMGRGMKLHPLAVYCGVLAGGEMAGVAGNVPGGSATRRYTGYLGGVAPCLRRSDFSGVWSAIGIAFVHHTLGSLLVGQRDSWGKTLPDLYSRERTDSGF